MTALITYIYRVKFSVKLQFSNRCNFLFFRPEAQKIFDKYTVGLVRRLKKENAIKMFKEEFQLSDEQAEIVFEIFDTDKNGILSNWEYGLFYMTVGDR